jgi:hypothetical protein
MLELFRDIGSMFGRGTSSAASQGMVAFKPLN